MMMAPLLSVLNQLWALGLLALPRMSPTQARVVAERAGRVVLRAEAELGSFGGDRLGRGRGILDI